MRRPAGVLLAMALLGTGCAGGLVSQGRLRQEPFRDLLQRTEHARGIQAVGPIDARIISQDEVPRILTEQLRRDWTEEELDAYQQSLTAVGLWPADRSLEREMLAVYRAEVAGFYAPGVRALFLVEDYRRSFLARLVMLLARRDLITELTLSHEVVHLLQHQAHPELLEPDGFWKFQDDVGNAVQAAIEGDATRYGMAALDPDFPLPSPGWFASQMEQDLEVDGSEAFLQAPALLRLTLAFPYTAGYALSYHEGTALLEAPPASTEQALHPEQREAPFLVMNFSCLEEALPQGCERLHENSMGELGLSVLFRDLGDQVPPAAWEGWDGDRYLAARCDGSRAFLWWTAWDTEADADEFADFYQEVAGRVAERGGLVEPPGVSKEGREVWIATPGLEPLRDAARACPRARVRGVDEVRAHFARHDETGTALSPRALRSPSHLRRG